MGRKERKMAPQRRRKAALSFNRVPFRENTGKWRGIVRGNEFHSLRIIRPSDVREILDSLFFRPQDVSLQRVEFIPSLTH